LLTEVWGYAPGVVTKAVKKTVMRLRRKIEADPTVPDHILAVRGVGYRFEPYAAPIATVHEQPVAPVNEPTDSDTFELEPSTTAQTTGPIAPLESTPDAFIGRQKALDGLAQLVGDGARLITVTGAPGVGKSRLCAEFAQRFEDREVLYWDLATASSLQSHLSSNWDSTDESTDSEGVERALEELGPAVAILDQFDRQKADGPVLIHWLETLPNLLIMVTSRAPLQLKGEHTFQLEPLSVPKPDARLPDLATNEAISLFTSRAIEADSGFALSDENADSIRDIVIALDGLPLAIELATSRLSMMTPSAIRARLGQRFKLLRNPNQGTNERHTSLRRAFDWSWDPLQPWERVTLIQCSLFHGSFTLSSAEAVVDLSQWPDAPWVLDVLDTLVAQSLIVTSNVGDLIKLELLNSLRVYAQEHFQALNESEQNAIKSRHLDDCQREDDGAP